MTRILKTNSKKRLKSSRTSTIPTSLGWSMLPLEMMRPMLKEDLALLLHN